MAKQGQIIANGAFQLLSDRRSEQVSEVLTDIFGREDVTAIAADWRGVVYFTLTDDPDVDASTVLGFDPSNGGSGELASVDEVLAAVRAGEIADAVDTASFDAWRDATGTRSLDMGDCVPPAVPEIIGGDPAERTVETMGLVQYIATAAALMGRLEALGVQPGDEVPDAVFDEERWQQ